MTRNAHELYAEYTLVGVHPMLSPENAKTLARTLIAEPAYQDPKHDLHALVVSDVAQLYEMSTPPDEG